MTGFRLERQKPAVTGGRVISAVRQHRTAVVESPHIIPGGITDSTRKTVGQRRRRVGNIPRSPQGEIVGINNLGISNEATEHRQNSRQDYFKGRFHLIAMRADRLGLNFGSRTAFHLNREAEAP